MFRINVVLWLLMIYFTTSSTVIEMARVALWSSGDRMVHVTMELMYEHHSQRPTYIYFDRIGIIQTTAISAID